MIILMIFMALAFGQPDDSLVVEEQRSDFQKIQIYVDISQVIAPNGSVGTSEMLNNLISYHAQSHDLLKGKLQYWSNPTLWRGEIDIYEPMHWHSINQMFIRSQRRKRIEENATTPTDAINRALMEFEYGSNGSTESQELLQLPSDGNKPSS